MTTMDMIQMGSKLVPNKLRGAMIVAMCNAISQFARVSWNKGVKLGFVGAVAGAKTGIEIFKTAKFAKALNIIGAIDTVGDLMVNSQDIDGKWWSLLPGSGMIQLGAAISNKILQRNDLSAKFAWEA